MLHRRSSRMASQLPIRVYGTDFKGMDFVEDSTTLVVNLHGAKILLTHQLIPEQELRILCYATNREAVFRVVGRAASSENRHSFWGVETINPKVQIWGKEFPLLATGDQTATRVLLKCPECRTRELLFMREALIQAIQESGGLIRTCVVCGRTGMWNQIPFDDA